MRQRIAHTITVDHRPWDEGGGLYIEGVRVPFATSPEITVDDIEGFIGAVGVTFYADNVEVVSKGGERRIQQTTSFEHELEFARREARRIVHEGMADVLEWLWDGRPQIDPLTPQGHYVMGLDEKTRQALLSTPTHSQSEQPPTEGDNQ